MAEEFSEEEKKLLAPFVSNLDKPVFVLRNLPEVVKGALFSRYSRSTKSLRRTLLDEFILNKEIGFNADSSGFENLIANSQERVWQSKLPSNLDIATEKAEAFYDRVLVGYGDDSVAELAGAHIALEDISIVATKIVEDARIGLSPLEKSTRYVYFDQKDSSGNWRYYRDSELESLDGYIETCDLLFETYAKLIPKISKFVSEKMPESERAKLSERAFESVIRSKTCDIIRGILPASTKTNMGFFGNGRAYEYLITKMYADSLLEIRELANAMQTELRTTIPSFVKRPDTAHGKDMQKYIQETRLDGFGAQMPPEPEAEDVVLVDYDKEAENKIVAAALYPYTNRSMHSLLQDSRHMTMEPGAPSSPNASQSKTQDHRNKIIDAYVGNRVNRRHKPSRAFEMPYYTFDICGNFGAYRDIHRHRVLTQQRQALGCSHGYTLPKEIVESGHESEFKAAMDSAKQAWEQIAKKHPLQAQYTVPLAYRIRWHMTMNLREAIHFCELRSAMQGHIDYRRIAQKMSKEIERVHPNLAKHMKFVDMSEYGFERLEAEKKLDLKLKTLGELGK